MSTYNRRTCLKAAGASGIVSLAGCLTGSDDDGGYPSQNIEWIIPYGEGGGFDTYARGAQEMWEEEIEEQTGNSIEIVIDNQPGGGGIQGTEQIYSAQGDEYTIGFANIPGFVQNELFQDVTHEMTEMSGLGRFTQSTWLLAMESGEAVDDYEELADWDQVDFANTGVGSTGWYTTVVLSDHLGINDNIVSGYDGLATDAPQSVVGGENDALIAPFANLSGFIEDDELVPILAWAEEEGTATVDAPITEEQDGMEGWASALNLSRVAIAPPGVDDGVVETLRDTLVEVIKSDEFNEWGEETENPVNNPADGETVDEIIVEAFDQLQEFEDLFEQRLE